MTLVFILRQFDWTPDNEPNPVTIRFKPDADHPYEIEDELAQSLIEQGLAVLAEEEADDEAGDEPDDL